MNPQSLEAARCRACADVWKSESEQRAIAEDELVHIRGLALQALALLQLGAEDAAPRAIAKLKLALVR